MAGHATRQSRAAIFRRALLAALGCAPWLLASQGCARAARGPVRWQLAPDAAEDRIAVREDAGSALFEVQSPRGIGGATVRRVSDARPHAIVLRFRLQGLEELRFEYDSTAVTASLSGTGTVLEEVRTAGRPRAVRSPGSRQPSPGPGALVSGAHLPPGRIRRPSIR